MRFRHPDGQTVHLAYCSNVHPGEDLDGDHRPARPLRAGRCADTSAPTGSGVGLWLRAPVARELADDPAAIERLRAALARAGSRSSPSTASPTAASTTRSSSNASTGPTGPSRPASPTPSTRPGARPAAARRRRARQHLDPAARLAPPVVRATGSRRRDQLGRLAERLHGLRERTGRTIRVGSSPSPAASSRPRPRPPSGSAALDPTCSASASTPATSPLGFEDAAAAVPALTAAGWRSSRRRSRPPCTPSTRPTRRPARPSQAFDEPRFLHQTRARPAGAPGCVPATTSATPSAASTRSRPGRRVGRHRSRGGCTSTCRCTPAPSRRSPRHGRPAPSPSTRSSAAPRAVTDHLEVETYTWSVLPPALRPTDDAALAAGIAGELAWLRDR